MLFQLAFVALAAPPIDLTADMLVIERGSPSARSAIQIDPVQYALVTGALKPEKGDEVAGLAGKKLSWKAAKGTGGDERVIRDKALANGYAFATFEADKDQVMILTARAHAVVLVNGEPRMGDPYSNGSVSLPVLMHKGRNEFLFACGRGELAATLSTPVDSATILSTDATFPDLVRDGNGGGEPAWAAVMVSNNSESAMKPAKLRAKLGQQSLETALPPVEALSVRKVGVSIPPATTDEAEQKVTIELVDETGKVRSSVDFPVSVKKPGQTFKRTFVSGIDGSVQYYSVVPASVPKPDGLVLSLHGASVEATGQAACFQPLDWANVVCPTNRRAFGFDWEDWGTIDALEVLEHASAKQPTLDYGRVFVTGHSMGGHGTWVLSTLYPTRFAAAGPCASWPSFWQYGNAPEFEAGKPFSAVLTRATSPYRTLDRLRNLVPMAVHILHGDADETVPVDLARSMRKSLGEFHSDFAYREKPGAGHWYGNDSVADPQMLEFFKARRRGKLDAFELTLPSPRPFSIAGMSPSTFEQRRPMEMSTISVKWDEKAGECAIKTTNCLSMNLVLPQTAKAAEVDGTKLDVPRTPGGMFLRREKADGAWAIGAPSTPRPVGVKAAFDRRFVLIYGTHGTPGENAWAFAKARYDAEQWWYRGNGSATVRPDTALETEQIPGIASRGVILYGHADMNSAWGKLAAADAPVRMRRGKVTIGERTIEGQDLFGAFLAPRATGNGPLAVVAGTGAVGMMTADRLTYFSSGTGFPDALIGRADMLIKGQAGLEAAEFYSSTWGLERE